MPNTRSSQLLLLQQKSKVPPNNQQVLTVPTTHPQAQKQSTNAEATKVQAYSKKVKKKTTKKTLIRTERPITIRILQRQKRRRQKRRDGKPTPAEDKIFKNKYTSKGAALFGSVKNLKDETKLPRRKVRHFLHSEPAYTKYRAVRRKIPRLKVIVYDIDELWSVDLA